MKRIKIVGLTGQSGAGKSTVSAYFAKNGMCVINADEIVKNLYTPDSVCLKAVSGVFGQDIILSDGNIDRPLLAKRAFSSKENTHLLNSIVHPFVTYEFMQMAKQAQTDGKSVVIYDAPQLFPAPLCPVRPTILILFKVNHLKACRSYKSVVNSHSDAVRFWQP